MIESAQPAGFIPTADPERAHAFYGEALGLPLVERTPFAWVYRLRGMTLRVTIVGEFTPAPFTIFGWEVEDISAAVADLSARGIGFARFPGLEQDELGVWTAPGGAQIAWFRDPDGNTLSLAQMG